MYLLENLTTLPADQRAAFLADNADEKIQGFTYSREIGPEEHAENLESFARISGEVNRLKDEKAALMSKLTADIKAVEVDAKGLLHLIEMKREILTGDVYMIRDEANLEIILVAPSGEIIERRNMRQHEKQLRIPLNRASGL